MVVGDENANRLHEVERLASQALVFRFDYSDLAGTQIGGLFFGGKKWVRSLSSCENTWSRVVSRNLNL
jgi:hypothetical protein